MSVLINFSSADSPDAVNPHDVSFTLPQLSTANLLRYNVTLDSCIFTNVAYPISSDRGNNIVYFQENSDTGTTYEATIISDTYTGTEFATHLSSIMTAASGLGYTYTVSYDSSTKKLTFSEAANSAFLIVDGDSTAHREIGWDIVLQTAFVTASTVGAQPLNLAGSLYVDVYSSLSTNNISTSSTGSLLTRIPLTAAFGEIQFHTDFIGVALTLNDDSMAVARFYLRDDRNKAYVLPSHFPVSYTVRLTAD